MAVLLLAMGREAERARDDLAVAEQLAGKDELSLADIVNFERHRGLATDVYHAAEQRVRLELWDLGDAARVGEPPVPHLPLTPRQSGWKSMFFGPPGFHTWTEGLDGQPVGVDEDGRKVPAHRGRPQFIEFQENGIGGLLRRIPGLGRRLKIGP
ncbi:MAG: hypothetical protein ACRDZ3_05135 [Acidimicrobiia bacterium]